MSAVRTTQVHLPPGMVDFGIGQPGFELLPLALLERAARHRFAQGDPYFLNYGYEQGDGYCRLALADLLRQHGASATEPEHLLLTAGASQGLDLICTLFSQPGDVVFVEEPTYFLALRIFADHGLRVVGIPTDENGLDLEALAGQLRQVRPAFLYTIPTFQNPTGVTMPAAHRERLVRLSQEHELLVVADEVYHLLSFDRPPPEPLAAYAQEAPILSLGSFSKILAPGLRLGWIHSSPAWLRRLVGGGLVDSGGGLNPFAAAVVRSVLELDLLLPHLTALRAAYRSRRDALVAALQAHLPTLRFRVPEGGFFLWAELPGQEDAGRLLQVARRHQVGFLPGARCSSRQGLRHYLRLSFAFHDPPALAEGVKRLRQAMEEMRT
ncbi:PLP-dependent aminotransferase family protein [Litorilinea aerophila]|uniref:PLP-dependent aminotransferase family protein n=1 Tax=Litorilinea aerophila TaxID=1204385 RepID=A0A540V8G7_9CHLR|nr:PLP-dependent aminotransferase family protein [Litorilinea aerophila]MCC9079028.1 PLP-dependent aminotransferase family protein [Litorilinea aerophila]GIV78811.1 MAG: aminotransferase [Litorilinea sp.]